MNLFIRIKNNQPYEHPIFEDNFRQVFPYIDVEKLPPEFARFERIEAPIVGVYEVYEGVTYEWVDGIVKDVHHVRDMTEQEKLDKQNEVKVYWAEHGFASWVFNEEICRFEAPVPMPDDGKFYQWNEDTTSWEAINE